MLICFKEQDLHDSCNPDLILVRLYINREILLKEGKRNNELILT